MSNIFLESIKLEPILEDEDAKSCKRKLKMDKIKLQDQKVIYNNNVKKIVEYTKQNSQNICNNNTIDFVRELHEHRELMKKKEKIQKKWNSNWRLSVL